jgi:hypothetical protein
MNSAYLGIVSACLLWFVFNNFHAVKDIYRYRNTIRYYSLRKTCRIFRNIRKMNIFYCLLRFEANSLSILSVQFMLQWKPTNENKHFISTLISAREILCVRGTGLQRIHTVRPISVGSCFRQTCGVEDFQSFKALWLILEHAIGINAF